MLEAKAFTKGINPNINKQYKEETYNIDDNNLEENLDKDKDKEDLEGEAIKYTIFNN